MNSPLFVGIVGSRRRNTLHDRKLVFKLFDWLEERGDFVVVSGGCSQGADAFAEEAARIYEKQTVIFPVDKEGVSSKWEFRQRAFARNRLIAERSNEIYCLVAPDRKGGTENTILHARELKIPVYLITEAGEVYLSLEGQIPTCEPVKRLLASSSTG